ncbi:MAG TPA: hypothetical protein VGF34_02030 [Stellaceae bacterium]
MTTLNGTYPNGPDKPGRLSGYGRHDRFDFVDNGRDRVVRRVDVDLLEHHQFRPDHGGRQRRHRRSAGSGGTVINGAYISGGKQGVSIGLGAGTVVNEGGVIAATATQSTGVYLHAGGTATNKDLITGPRVTIADLFYVS